MCGTYTMTAECDIPIEMYISNPQHRSEFSSDEDFPCGSLDDLSDEWQYSLSDSEDYCYKFLSDGFRDDNLLTCAYPENNLTLRKSSLLSKRHDNRRLQSERFTKKCSTPKVKSNCFGKRERTGTSFKHSPEPCCSIPLNAENCCSPTSLIPPTLTPRPCITCKLPFNGHSEDESHYTHCEINMLGLILRDEQSSWFQKILCPEDSKALDTLKQTSGFLCKQIVLENSCTTENCSFIHNLDINFNVSEFKNAQSLKTFVKWFLTKSKPLNFKVLLKLLSSVSQGFGEDILMVILTFASVLPDLKPEFQRPLGISLIQKLVNLMNLNQWEAIRTIIIFNFNPEKDNKVADGILNALGVFEDCMAHCYDAASCIWHMSETYKFPSCFIFSMMKECIKDRRADIKFTKNKFIAQLFEISRADVIKEYSTIDKFLRLYFPQNSFVTHYVKSVVMYKWDPSAIVNSWKDSYCSTRVKGTGDVNPNWKYWDVTEAKRIGFTMVSNYLSQLGLNEPDIHMRVLNNITESQTVPVNNLIFVDDIMEPPEQLLASLSGKNSILTTHQEPIISVDIKELEESLNNGEFQTVSSTLMRYNHPLKAKLMKSCQSTLLNLLYNFSKEKLPHAVCEILKCLPQSLTEDSLKFSARSTFIHTVNSLVVRFYKNRDFKNAMKLLKTLRLSNVNSLEYVPEDLNNKALYTVICCDIHFELRCFREAIRILFYGNCIKYIHHGFADIRLADHFCHFERVVLKMLKKFVIERLPAFSVSIFRALLMEQRNLTFPINLGRYYESVLCTTFLTSLKSPCSPHDGANLYMLVDRVCGNDIQFTSNTYRGLIIELLNAKAPQSIMRRTLLLCFKVGVYPNFSTESIILSTRLTTEEMSFYIAKYLQYHNAQSPQQTLFLNSLTINLIEETNPPKSSLPIHNKIDNICMQVTEAKDRLKAALQQIAGAVYGDLFADFSSPSSVKIPSVGIVSLLEVLQLNENTAVEKDDDSDEKSSVSEHSSQSNV